MNRIAWDGSYIGEGSITYILLGQVTLRSAVAVVDAPPLAIIVKVMVYPSRAKVDVSNVKVLHP